MVETVQIAVLVMDMVEIVQTVILAVAMVGMVQIVMLVVGYSGDDSTSSEDNSAGNYGGIAGTEYSGAVSNDETDTTSAVADSLSFTGDSYDAKGLNEEGITGGEPCSYDATTDFTGYSIDDYTQSLYTYDTSAEATETAMNDIENTIDNVVDTVSDWVSICFFNFLTIDNIKDSL